MSRPEPAQTTKPDRAGPWADAPGLMTRPSSTRDDRIARRRSSQPTAYLRRAPTMVNPDPSAESSDGSPTQPETPEQTGPTAGTGGNPAARPQDTRRETRRSADPAPQPRHPGGTGAPCIRHPATDRRLDHRLHGVADRDSGCGVERRPTPPAPADSLRRRGRHYPAGTGRDWRARARSCQSIGHGYRPLP